MRSFEALLKYNGAGYIFDVSEEDSLGSGVLLVM
jgi:hypothetical protein